MGDIYLVSSGRNLIIEGTASVETRLVFDGGSLTVQRFAGAGSSPTPDPKMFDLHRGTLSITDEAVTIASFGMLGDNGHLLLAGDRRLRHGFDRCLPRREPLHPGR
jgi:hypothetical protein